MTSRDLLLHARRKCECEGTTLTSGLKWQSVQHRRSQQASGCRGTQFAYPSSPDRLGVHNAGSGAMPTGTPGCFCRKASTSKACSYAASSLSTARWTGRPGLPARPPAARSARPTRRTRRRRRRGRRRRGARQRREWAAREASREGGKERRRCGLRAGQALTACLHEATQHVRSVQGGWQKKKTPRTGPI
jgi:hypothetical protein